MWIFSSKGSRTHFIEYRLSQIVFIFFKHFKGAPHLLLRTDLCPVWFYTMCSIPISGTILDEDLTADPAETNDL